MTATLRPPASAVSRHDPALRLQDYLRALSFYLTVDPRVIDRIIFIDNSAADMTAIAALAHSRTSTQKVEVLSFNGNDHPVAYGKAYGEFRLIDHAVEHSSLLRDGDVFWKVTGRLKVENLERLVLAMAARSFDIACDLHNVPMVGSRRWVDHEWMDLRLFASTVAAYRSLLLGTHVGHKAGFDQHHLYNVVYGARARLRVIPRFPLQPLVAGISGRHNRPYESGAQRIRDSARSILRRVAPFIWL